MHPDTQALLALVAEIGIATVALSGITMVLLVSGGRMVGPRSGEIAAQLSMAFVVVVASMFPLFLTRLPLTGETLWLVGSGFYLAIILSFQGARFLGIAAVLQVKGSVGVIVSVPAFSGIVLLGTNLWLRTDLLHLAQLFIALWTSMILYLFLVYAALRGVDGDDAGR